MSTLVIVDCGDGTLTRLECSAPTFKRTHRAQPITGPTYLTAKMVENFRLMPPDEFSIDPGPRPTNPPMAANRRAA